MPKTIPAVDIEREMRNLNAILEVSRALSSEVQLESLLQVVVQKTLDVMEAERTSLFLYDEGRQELWSKIAQELGPLQEIRFPVGVGIAGHVAQMRQGVNLPDAYLDPRFNPAFDKQTQEIEICSDRPGEHTQWAGWPCAGRSVEAITHSPGGPTPAIWYARIDRAGSIAPRPGTGGGETARARGRV